MQSDRLCVHHEAAIVSYTILLQIGGGGVEPAPFVNLDSKLSKPSAYESHDALCDHLRHVLSAEGNILVVAKDTLMESYASDHSE